MVGLWTGLDTGDGSSDTMVVRDADWKTRSLIDGP